MRKYSYGLAFSLEDWQEKKNPYVVTKLSEEHGWIQKDKAREAPGIGSKMIIIPNHSCVVANLTDYYSVINKEKDVVLWKVDARGAVR